MIVARGSEADARTVAEALSTVDGLNSTNAGKVKNLIGLVIGA